MNNKITNPPQGAIKLLRWICLPNLVNAIEGDLIELFDEDLKKKGYLIASLNFYWSVIKLIRPELTRSVGIFNIIFPGLFQSMMRSTVRKLRREKAYAITNLFGLTVGFMVFFVTLLYTDYENSYDQFLDGHEDIYRLDENWNRSGDEETWSAIKARLTPYIQDHFPGIYSTRLFKNGRFEIRVEDRIIQASETFYVDSSFLKVFPFQAVEGHPIDMLQNPDQVILTETLAKKIFIDKPALQEVIQVNGKSLVVSGVIQDPPANTHVHFDMLVSLNEILPRFSDFHLNDNMWYTYAKVPIGQLSFFEKSLNESLDEIPGYIDDLSIVGNQCAISLRPVSSIHLQGDAEREIEANGNGLVVRIIGMIGWFVLFMSGINYVNLAASRSMNRAAEVGIRKIHGSSKSMISMQFLTESLLLCMIALALAASMVYCIMPEFNAFFNLNIILSPNYALEVLSYGACVALLFGLLSGAYPAMEMSRVSAMSVLRANSVNKGMGGSVVRRGFIGFQLMISVFTIMAVVIVSSQLDYVQNKNMGFDSSKRIIIPLNPNSYFEAIERMKEAMVNEPSISNVTSAFTYPGKRFPFFTFRFPNLNASGKVNPTQDDGSIWMRTVFGDTDMLSAFGLELVDGRNFSRQIPDGSAVEFIVNESAARFFGLENPVGETVELTQNTNDPVHGRIIGMVKDFNYASLHNAVEPVIIFPSKHRFSRQYMTVFFEDDAMKTADLLEENWRKYLGNAPLTYSFLDDEYRQLYKTESHLKVFIAVLATISVVISMIGLLGMSFYAMEQKKHEIGVRKVLGASVWSILRMNLWEYFGLSLLAVIVVMPITYWLGLNWLSNFAYSVSIGISTFGLTIGFVGFLVLMSVGYNVLAAALKNPVDAISSR